MTTDHDKFRQLAQERRETASQVTGYWMARASRQRDIECADAIDALLAEADALTGDKCQCGHSKNLHPTTPHRDGRCERGGCVCLKYIREDVFAERDTLARERDELLARLALDAKAGFESATESEQKMSFAIAALARENQRLREIVTKAMDLVPSDDEVSNLDRSNLETKIQLVWNMLSAALSKESSDANK
jgi:hypothetical protein